MRWLPFRDPPRRRNSLRHPRFDYQAPGAYFVTVCTWRRLAVFGHIARGRMAPDPLGRSVGECWRAIPGHFPHITLGEWAVMPDHFHGIVIIGPRPTAFRNHGCPAGGAWPR